MKQPLKRLVTAVAVVALGLAGLLVTASPASAERVPTSIDQEATLVTCTSPCDGAPVGIARVDSLARSYCRIGADALIYSVGANRFAFVPQSSLVNEAQSAICTNGGTFAQSVSDIELRRCAGTTGCAPLEGDTTPQDNLQLYCQQNDATGVSWVALFNTNGPQTGFARASEIDRPVTLPSC